MIEEQKKTVEIFNTYLKNKKSEKLVLYGTGINAEAVVKNCHGFQFVGLMDAVKTGEKLWGLTVLSYDEVLEMGATCVVVVARPAVHAIIYKRIQAWSEKNGILVCDIYGRNLSDKIRDRRREMPYFAFSYESLIEEIKKHEVVSFDIFDTLLVRNVYESADVFYLLDREYNDSLPFHFSQVRAAAERELLLAGEPNIYQIYDFIGKKYHLSASKCQELLRNEIEKEKAILAVRDKMRKCFRYCVSEGKKVYLVSDMYFTRDILQEILESFGICEYEGIIVSCDYGCSKQNGLFEIFKKSVGSSSWIHIGDNHESDYLAAIKSGGDAFEILSPIRMMELTTYDTLLGHIQNVEMRVMLGMMAAQVFNDPFALYHSNGMPKIKDLEDFGYLFIAPLLIAFMVWLFSVLKREPDSLLLFSARDGWLLQKIYHMFRENYKLEKTPQDIYLLISRRAACMVADEGEKYKEERKNYLNYLNGLELKRYKYIYFFDFMSRGTCQSKLEEITGRKMQGVYFQKSVSGDIKKDSIQALCFFKEKNAYEKNLRIFAMCDFLECILTSPQPSFWKMDAEGYPLYEQEQRTKEQMCSVEKIHAGILAYCNKFMMVMKKLKEGALPPEFCDEILRCTDGDFSRIDIPELKKFMLDDWLGGDKNTGLDVLS